LNAEELEDRIAAFPLWGYQFEFENGVRTPIADWQRVNRQVQRRRHFFEPLLSLTGGSLAGKRVLDLGCSSGFWALEAIEAGADFVLGVEASETAVEQANLVFEAKGVDRDRYRFDVANVFDYELAERFDVILCLGLLNVVSKPVALFELMSAAEPELIVLDTGLSKATARLFEVSRLVEPRNRVDYDMVLVPTRRAVVELAGQFGLQAVPLAQNITDYTSMDDYRSQQRLAFICSKNHSLSSLAAEPEPPGNAWLAALERGTSRVRERLRG